MGDSLLIEKRVNMENTTLSMVFDLVKYVLPVILMGLFMWYAFKKYTEAEKRRTDDMQDMQKVSMPVRFQAYERIALLLERISPLSLVCRVQPYSEGVEDYVRLLKDHIEQEYEYNLSQQVYLSDAAWQMVKAARIASECLIDDAVREADATTVAQVKEAVIQYCKTRPVPSEEALSYIKKEIRAIF